MKVKFWVNFTKIMTTEEFHNFCKEHKLKNSDEFLKWQIQHLPPLEEWKKKGFNIDSDVGAIFEEEEE